MPGAAGIGAQLALVPDSPGIYAWHYQYEDLIGRLRGEGDYADVPELLIKEIERPHMLQRKRLISEVGIEVTLRSKRKINKLDDISDLLAGSAVFREQLAELLASAHNWQVPLYVGKASNLRVRVKQHLDPVSDLRERLAKVEIDIERCALHCMETGTKENSGLLEEIAARLFLPPFCERLG